MLSSTPAAPAPAPLQPYQANSANEAGMRTIVRGTLALVGFAALAVVLAWNSRSVELPVPPAEHRTKLDLPARECPTPQRGQVLTITVARISDDQFATGCHTIKGRSA